MVASRSQVGLPAQSSQKVWKCSDSEGDPFDALDKVVDPSVGSVGGPSFHRFSVRPSERTLEGKVGSYKSEARRVTMVSASSPSYRS